MPPQTNMDDHSIADYVGVNTYIMRTKSGFSRQNFLEALELIYGLEMHSTTLRRIELGEQQAKAIEAATIAQFFEQDVFKFISEPIDERLAELHELQDKVYKLQETLYDSAREFRRVRKQLAKTLEEVKRQEVVSSSVYSAAQGLMHLTEVNDEAANQLIRTWNREARGSR